MTRQLLAMILHLETLEGPVKYEKLIPNHGDFRAAAVLASAVIASEWTLNEAAEECIREWFTRRDGDAVVTVQCLRAPTVIDWTIKNEAKQRKAVG